MIHRQVFEKHGIFDENLPACEDYDLWLRLSSRLPIGLVPEKLIIKRDGPWEQLSYQHSLDKYRIIALTKILSDNPDSPVEHQTRGMLAQKCRIYSIGCHKHNQTKELEWIEHIIAKFHLSFDH
jgi:hypothetical protein